MINRLLVWIFFVLLPPAIFAQTITVTGRVTDAETNEGIPFATIELKGQAHGLSTDFDGYFKLEFKRTSDSLVASCVGYNPITLRVKKTSKPQHFNIELKRASYTHKQMMALQRSESRALTIIDSVVKFKKAHNRKKLDSYRYEAYTKIQVELEDLTQKFQNRKIFRPFQFIFKNVDSSTQMKPFLPFFLTETVSDFHYSRKPVPALREVIKGSKVSGISELNVSQFLGNTYTHVDIYEDNIQLLGREFISPVSAFGMRNYMYYLVDSQYINHIKCYKVRFIPKEKRKQPLLEGEIWVAEKSFAIKQVSMRMRAGEDINLVQAISLYNEFVPVSDSVWMLKKEQIAVHFSKPGDAPGLVARKMAWYRNFVINEKETTIDSLFLKNSQDVLVADSVNFRSEAYWHKARQDSLSLSEKQVYAMIDTLNNMPRFKNYVNIAQMLALGYYDVGPISIGYIYSFLSEDSWEGWRLQFGMRTSPAFSKTVRLGGYMGYGFGDNQVKYGFNLTVLIKKDPRRALTASFRNDYSATSNFNVYSGLPDLFSTYGLRRREDGQYIPFKLVSIREFKLAYTHEFDFGYSIAPGFTNRSLRPIAPFNFTYTTAADAVNPGMVIHSATISELTLTQRFAWQENFLEGNFWRTSLGTKFPVVWLQLAVGVKRVMGGQFNYQRIAFSSNDFRNLGIAGKLKWNIDVGKIFGNLPFLFLQAADASETYITSWYGFNTIHRYEFIADRYVKVFVDHHLEGLLFDQIPGFKKLKLREVYGMRMWWGDMTQANFNGNYANMQANPTDKGLVQLQLADKVPLVEINAGVENIFRFFRIDAVWRATHLDPEGTRFSFRYGNFGLRIAFQWQF